MSHSVACNKLIRLLYTIRYKNKLYAMTTLGAISKGHNPVEHKYNLYDVKVFVWQITTFSNLIQHSLLLNHVPRRLSSSDTSSRSHPCHCKQRTRSASVPTSSHITKMKHLKEKSPVPNRFSMTTCSGIPAEWWWQQTLMGLRGPGTFLRLLSLHSSGQRDRAAGQGSNEISTEVRAPVTP